MALAYLAGRDLGWGWGAHGWQSASISHAQSSLSQAMPGLLLMGYSQALGTGGAQHDL